MFKELLIEKIEKLGSGPTELEGVTTLKMTEPIINSSGTLPPSICLIAQGKKKVFLGNKEFIYDEKNLLLGSVNVPIQAQLLDISKEKPYYGFAIIIDPVMISELLIEIDQYKKDHVHKKAEGLLTTVEITENIIEPIVRLVNILDKPLELKILGKQYLREILFQILLSEGGSFLKNCVTQHSKAHAVTPIIHYMEKNLQEDISIDDLKKQAGMSSSSLHENFKEATSLPPMQYLKKLRLNHANELLLNGSNVSEAAINSGYNSTNQFSREFKREYGISPSKVGQVA